LPGSFGIDKREEYRLARVLRDTMGQREGKGRKKAHGTIWEPHVGGQARMWERKVGQARGRSGEGD